PSSKGVYLFEDFQYRPLTRVELQRCQLETKETVFGARVSVDVATLVTEPLILCYKMERFDVQLCRVVEVQAGLAEAQDPNYRIAMWVVAENLPVHFAPIDELEQSLMQLRTARPFEPGTYAVHWGAFNGYTNLDSRVFLFRVISPDEEKPAEEVALPEESPAAEEKPAPPKEPPAPVEPEPEEDGEVALEG
ncbi:MAG: hypothetical protein QG656_1055, partial [Candidatus Hydrogenedentes bacterium]|nr:hypothetical protein [Candidatus Hydrogenedentota bacterium]